MKKITALKILENYRIWLRFDDGVEGNVEFSPYVGRGVFAPWTDYAFFREGRIDESGRTLSWPAELDFCADALWLQITGKQPDQLLLRLRQERPAHADP